MYVWTNETRAIMDEIREYIFDHKVIPGAPKGTKEKYDRMLKLLDEERERQIQMMMQ